MIAKVSTKGPLMVAERLVKEYHNGVSVQALCDVSFELAQGEFLALMGPSGSGKTTLLNLLGFLDAPTYGRIIFEGMDLVGLDEEAQADFRRENIGFIFELFYLRPELNALDNVMLPLVPYRRRLDFDLKERAEELLVAVGLGERLGHLPGQLSGGEQQRVAVARALINHPKVLLADEPTGNLDSRSGQEIIGLLRRMIQDRGVTIVLVTHDIAIAGQADRIIQLEDGKLFS